MHQFVGKHGVGKHGHYRLPHPAIRPFVHFLVHLLLLLAIESTDVNYNMIFKYIKLVEILLSIVLM